MEQLYDRLGRQAFGLAYRIVGDGPSAEDVVQEAFLTLWRNAERLDPARGKVTSFVLTLVHHKAVDLLRARRGQPARDPSVEPEALERAGPDVAEAVAASLNGQAVRESLKSLPAEQRQAIEMAYFEGMTHVEIAEKLELPLGTVKSRLRLGLEKLRSTLGIEAER